MQTVKYIKHVFVILKVIKGQGWEMRQSQQRNLFDVAIHFLITSYSVNRLFCKEAFGSYKVKMTGCCLLHRLWMLINMLFNLLSIYLSQSSSINKEWVFFSYVVFAFNLKGTIPLIHDDETEKVGRNKFKKASNFFFLLNL